MSNYTFDALCDMLLDDNDFPAFEQALNEGADVNMVGDEVDSPNLAFN